jgi:hypothetical protein
MDLQNVFRFFIFESRFNFIADVDKETFETTFNKLKGENIEGRIIDSSLNSCYISDFANWLPSSMPALDIKLNLKAEGKITTVSGKFNLNAIPKLVLFVPSFIIVILYLINFNGIANQFGNFPFNPLIAPLLAYLFLLFIFIIELTSGQSYLGLITKKIERAVQL